MMNAMLPIVALAILTVTCWSAMLVLYRLRDRWTIIPLYVFVGISIFLAQNLMDFGFSVPVGRYSLYVGSVSFFTSAMLGVLLLYLLEGVRAARLALVSMVAVTVFYAFVVLLVVPIAGATPWVAFGPEGLLRYGWSTIAMVADVVFIAVAWELLSGVRRLPVFSRVFIVILGAFAIDSFVYITGFFAGNPAYAAILSGSLTVRLVLAAAVTPVVTLFLRSRGFSETRRLKPSRIWEILNFRSDLETRLRTMDDLLRREQELVQELDKFKKAMEGASLQFIIADAEGNIQFANPMTEHITGFSLSEMMHKKAGSPHLWGGLMPKSFYERLWHTIKVEKRPFSGEIINHRKSGEQYVAYAVITPIIGANGNVEFFLSSERDITKEKEVDRLKTEFVSLVTHQLKTPITATKWNLEMLIGGDYGALSPDQRKAVQMVAEINGNMDELVKALLNISRMESGRVTIEPKPTDLTALYGQVTEELKASADERHVTVTVEDSYKKTVSVDAGMLREAFRNLLSNAIKYSPRGAAVTVHIVQSDGFVKTSVTDTGMGIPKDEQVHIFTKFYRATNAVRTEQEGTGLGLYLAKQIVEASGGKIGFESREGKGSVFWYTLPAVGLTAKQGETGIS